MTPLLKYILYFEIFLQSRGSSPRLLGPSKLVTDLGEEHQRWRLAQPFRWRKVWGRCRRACMLE